MSYTLQQNSLSRTRIDKLVIKQDYCGNAFGVSPCTATGAKCYNTFPTCKDKIHFNKSVKDYEYVSGDVSGELARLLFPARPYLKPLSDLPTEIKENDTVTKVLKATFLDEPDKDIGVDPYYGSRSNVQGTYWKKWIVRNKNYKGRIVEQYEAFYSNGSLSEWQLKFVGRIENIILNKGSVTIEITDLLKKLSEYEYPLESKYSLLEPLPNIHICGSESEMLTLNAKQGDYAERQDFGGITGLNISVSYEQSAELLEGRHYVRVIAFDVQNRSYAIARGSADISEQGSGTGKLTLSWTIPASASYYKIYISTDSEEWTYKGQTAAANYTITNLDGTLISEFENAERIFELTGEDPTQISNWTANQNSMFLYTNYGSDFETSGYLQVEDETIYYNGKLSGTKDGNPVDLLIGIKRHQFNTEPAAHSKYSKLHYVFNYAAANGYTIAKDILTKAGIGDYLDSKFDTYEASGSSILFSCNPITKKTKLNKIFFDLVNVMDCYVWPGEDGLIKILKKSETPVSYRTITDKANIISGSGAVDLNESSRKTSWFLYWNKWDVDADLEDDKAYSFGFNIVDADAEDETEYGEKIENPQFTLWINENSGTREEIETYIENLLTQKKLRTRDAQTIYKCDLEMKDGALQPGELIKLTTNDLQLADGTAVENEIYRCILKTPKGNKINVKLIRENQFNTSLIDEE